MNLDRDFSVDQAAIVIEHDKDYMRIDHFNGYQEIMETLKNDDKNHFIYKYALADTFIKQVAFKIGKLEKFGSWLIIFLI